MKFLVFNFFIFYLIIYGDTYDLSSCKCRLRTSSRVVNGKIATLNFMPWMASLANANNVHFCGATIINENFVLTSAHCTEGFVKKMIKIRVGLNDILKYDEKNTYYAKRIIRHDFKKPGDFGDFSLIELKTPIKFKIGEIEPGCFNFKDDDFSGNFITAGWGHTARPWRDIHDKTGRIHYLPKTTSLLKYYFSSQVKENCANYNICTLAKIKGDSSCAGDSGGPLMYTKNGITSVVGMTSFTNAVIEGDKCYYCNGRVTYARLKMYLKYFNNYVSDYCSV